MTFRCNKNWCGRTALRERKGEQCRSKPNKKALFFIFLNTLTFEQWESGMFCQLSGMLPQLQLGGSDGSLPGRSGTCVPFRQACDSAIIRTIYAEKGEGKGQCQELQSAAGQR